MPFREFASYANDLNIQFVHINSEHNHADLPLAELQILNKFTALKRRRHFIAGRMAMRAAIRQIDSDVINHDFAIGADENGAPILPAELIGSISHSANWAVAAAHRGIFKALGVDIETRQQVDLKLQNHICQTGELAFDSASILRFFSCKESVFKAAYMLDKQFYRIGFKDIYIQFSGEQFCARVAEHRFTGICIQQNNVLLSLAYI